MKQWGVLGVIVSRQYRFMCSGRSTEYKFEKFNTHIQELVIFFGRYSVSISNLRSEIAAQLLYFGQLRSQFEETIKMFVWIPSDVVHSFDIVLVWSGIA